MIDIDQYSYTKEPFSTGKSFVIKPLDESGIKAYYNDDEAHTKTYLDKLNPRMLRKIHNELNNRHSEFNYEANKALSNNTNVQINESSNNNFVDNNEDINNNNNNNYNNNNFKNNFNVTNNNFNNINNCDLASNKSNFKKDTTYKYKPLDQKLAAFGCSNFGKKFNNTIQNPSNSFKNLRFGTTSYDNFYSNRNKCYNQEKHNSNYKKSEFESYNVPRILKKDNYNNNIKQNIKYNDFYKRCINSISNGFFRNNFIETDVKSNNFANEEERQLDYKLNLENNRLKNIISKQTNNEYLKEKKLPRLSYIADQPNIIIKNTGIGNSKFMGNNYNPHNFNLANFKNRIKRNTNGALFNN